MIMRGEHNNNFSVIQNEALRDPRLSLEARGLLAFMLTMTEDWQFSLEGLAAQTGIGRGKALRLIKELKSAGYLSIKKELNARGQFSGTSWVLYETPEDHSPKNQSTATRSTETRSTAIQSPENRTNKKYQYKEISNKEIPKEEVLSIGTRAKKFTPPTLEEVVAYCKERNNSVDPERWLSYYQANGWRVGKNPMKDWKAAVRTWERSAYNTPRRTEKNPPRDESGKMDEALRIALQRAEGGAV